MHEQIFFHHLPKRLSQSKRCSSMLSFQKTLVIVIEFRKQKFKKSNQSNINPRIPVKNTTKNFKTSQTCLQYKLLIASLIKLENEKLKSIKLIKQCIDLEERALKRITQHQLHVCTYLLFDNLTIFLQRCSTHYCFYPS